MLLLPTLIIISQFVRLGPVNLSWLLYVFLFCNAILNKNRNSTSIFLLIITVSYPIISSLWSFAPFFYHNLYFSLITGIFVLLYVSSLDVKRGDFFVKGVFISCSVFVLLGFFEMMTGHYLIIADNYFTHKLNLNGFHYPVVAFANPNDLGQYLAILLPLSSVYCFTKIRTKLVRYTIPFLNLLGLYVIFNSESNMSMITFVFTYAIYLFLSRQSGLNVSQKIIIVFVILIGMLIVNYKTSLIERIANNVLFVSTDDVHYTGRAQLYKELLATALMHPFGGFGNAYTVSFPHNLILYIADDFGLLIAASFLLLLATIMLKMFKNRYCSDDIVYSILLASLVMFPLSSSISSGNEQRKVIWIFLGICLHFYSAKRKLDASPGNEFEQKSCGTVFLNNTKEKGNIS